MKFGILITDLTAERAKEILDELTDAGDDVVETFEVSSGEVDKTGLPWDERIHAGSKSQNKDGSWKRKKGVQDIYVSQIEEELRNAATTAPVAPPMPPAPVAAPTAPVAPPMPPAPVAAPTAPVAPPMPPAPVAATIERDFKGLNTHLSNLFADGDVSPTYPNTIVQRINAGFNSTISSISDIAQNADMIEYAWQCIDVDGKGL